MPLVFTPGAFADQQAVIRNECARGTARLLLNATVVTVR